MSKAHVPRIREPKLKRGCNICSTTENLQSCPGCRVVHYCSDNHRDQDYDSHHELCQSVQSAKKVLDREEAILREESDNSVGGFYSVPANVFEDGVGFFWDILATRNYILARLSFIDTLLEIQTVPAVEYVVSEFKDIMTLCSRDSLDIRDRLPGQLLRLGKEMECYEFLKYWAVEDEDAHSEVESRPRPELTGISDVFEDPEMPLRLSNSEYEIGQLVPALLLKVSLYLSLREVQQVPKVLGRACKTMPAELVVNIQAQLANPALLANTDVLSDIRHGRNLAPHLATLRRHIGSLCSAISNAAGGSFWYYFYRRDRYMATKPPRNSLGNADEPAVMALRRNYRAFVEIPGAIRMTELCSLEEATGEEEEEYEESTEDDSHSDFAD